jgi:hypothetical protein
MPVLAICRGMQIMNVVHGGACTSICRAGRPRRPPRTPGVFSEHDVRIGQSRIISSSGATPSSRRTIRGSIGSARAWMSSAGPGRQCRGDRRPGTPIRDRGPLASRGGPRQAALRGLVEARPAERRTDRSNTSSHRGLTPGLMSVLPIMRPCGRLQQRGASLAGASGACGRCGPA